MSIRRPQFTIGRLMVVVAIVAVLLSLFPIGLVVGVFAGALLCLVPTFLTFSITCLISNPNQRRRASTWIAALWPLSIVLSVHISWAIFSGVLQGHPPGPKNYGFLCEVFSISVGFFILSSWIASMATLILSAISTEKSMGSSLNPLFATALSWLIVITVCHWDPFRAVLWFLT